MVCICQHTARCLSQWLAWGGKKLWSKCGSYHASVVATYGTLAFATRGSAQSATRHIGIAPVRANLKSRSRTARCFSWSSRWRATGCKRYAVIRIRHEDLRSPDHGNSVRSSNPISCFALPSIDGRLALHSYARELHRYCQEAFLKIQPLH
jgi:hypothetical protein